MVIFVQLLKGATIIHTTMRTMNVGKWFMVFMTACAVMACGTVDEPDPNISVPDPAGTIPLGMLKEYGTLSVTELERGAFCFYIDAGNNFKNSYSDTRQAEFIDRGIMAGLGNVTKIPVSGWGAPSIKVEVGHGYVARVENDEGQYEYLRLYVVDYLTSGNRTGFTVKYQYPFRQ